MTDLDEVIYRVRAITAAERMTDEERAAFFVHLSEALAKESAMSQFSAAQAEEMANIDRLVRGGHVTEGQAATLRAAALKGNLSKLQAAKDV